MDYAFNIIQNDMKLKSSSSLSKNGTDSFYGRSLSIFKYVNMWDKSMLETF